MICYPFTLNFTGFWSIELRCNDVTNNTQDNKKHATLLLVNYQSARGMQLRGCMVSQKNFSEKFNFGWTRNPLIGRQSTISYNAVKAFLSWQYGKKICWQIRRIRVWKWRNGSSENDKKMIQTGNVILLNQKTGKKRKNFYSSSSRISPINHV